MRVLLAGLALPGDSRLRPRATWYGRPVERELDSPEAGCPSVTQVHLAAEGDRPGARPVRRLTVVDHDWRAVYILVLEAVSLLVAGFR